ncbi:hypothetical protein [Paenibacillus sp. IHBB 3054]|uniref:hypothetical protein n=1 Tax=Paenibacillus sp. IHBB 3054 TaxID=3425689 RepID=UPI003F67B7BF
MPKQPKMKKSGLKPGDQMIMHSCYEARKEKYGDKVLTVDSKPWELADVKRLPEPIPAKGQQGLWNWGGVQP